MMVDSTALRTTELYYVIYLSIYICLYAHVCVCVCVTHTYVIYTGWIIILKHTEPISYSEQECK